jgi:LacI family transcriptional regulator
MGFPVVTFDGKGRLDFKTDDVSVNVYRAGQMQAEHLISLGRKRIAYVEGKSRCYINDQKREGFLDVFKTAGLKPPPIVTLDLDRFIKNHWTTDEIEQIRGHFLGGQMPWDAVAVVGDMIALGVIRIATEIGVQVPDDLAVIGCDGLATSGEGAIPLSTVMHDSEAIGRQGFELLKQRVDGERTGDNFIQIIAQPTIQIRRSTVKSAGRASLKPVG